MMLRQCLRAVVLLGALSGLAACGSGSTSVPWVNHRLRLQEAYTAQYPTSAPPCRAADLRLRVVPLRGVSQTVSYMFVFTNDSASSCLLRTSRPDVSATNPAGVRQLLRGPLFKLFGQDGRVVEGDLKPGEQASFDLFDSTAAICPGTSPAQPSVVRFTHIIVPLASGRVSADPRDAMSFWELCAFSSTKLGLPVWQFPPAPGPAGINSSLRPQLIGVPRTVRAGATFSYTVALYNSSSRRIVLHPCPGYTEDLDVSTNDGPFSQPAHAYELNCRNSGAIAAHATVAYQMRFAVPSHTPAGPSDLIWTFNIPMTENPPLMAQAHPRVTRR
jgi:hypothetical protein